VAHQLTPSPDAAPSCTFVDSTGPAPQPHGLIDLQVYKPGATFFPTNVFDNKAIAGVQIYVGWRYLEPSPNEIDMTTVDAIDQAFCQADQSKQFVVLDIVPGFATPSWLLPSLPRQWFGQTYHPTEGADYLPVPWENPYLSDWTAVVKWMAARYGSNAELSMVAADGPTSVSEEMSLPDQNPPRGSDPALLSKNELAPLPPAGSTSDLAAWIALGYTPSLYEQAWSTMFRAYELAFSRQFISFSIYQGLAIDNGVVDPSESSITLHTVFDEGRSIVGSRRFVFQGDGLQPNTHGVNSQFIESENCSIAATGFQTQGQSKTVVSPASLQGALARGAQGHVDFIELYNTLINPATPNPAYQPILKAAAHALAVVNDKKFASGGACAPKPITKSSTGG
jgi:hypothetical protein